VVSILAQRKAKSIIRARKNIFNRRRKRNSGNKKNSVDKRKKFAQP
jgi:hypothetical protein